MLKFRDLTKDDIEVRVQSAKQNGAVLLLYKNARVDMAILDETVGPENWQRDHYECKGNLFCKVGIFIDLEKGWVWKSDCGTESNTEKEKGEASDSFKRACTNWGIGRELYTSPFIWAKAEYINIKTESGKFKCDDVFKVKNIEIVNKKITKLEIVAKGKFDRDSEWHYCFSFGVPKPQGKDTTPLMATEAQAKMLLELCNGNAEILKEIKRKCGVRKVVEMTEQQILHAIAELKESA